MRVTLLVAVVAMGLFVAGLACGFILAGLLFVNRGE